VVIARGAVAEQSEDEAPVRLTFVEAIPEVEEPVVPEAGGGGDGPEAQPPEVVELPPPTKRRRRHVPMVRPDEPRPDEHEEETSEELELVVPDGDEAEEEDEEIDEGVASTEGGGGGSGEGSGGGTGGGTGTGTGTGTGSGVGPGHSDPIIITGGMERPRRRSGEHPRYTRQALEAGVEGVVRVLISIGRDGRVGEVRVIGSTVPLLNDEVVRKVREWRYSPYIYEGRPVDVRLIQSFRFNQPH
jgi:protein TonB